MIQPTSRRIPGISRRKQWMFRIIVLVLLFLLLEGLSLPTLVYLRKQAVVFEPTQDVDYESYLAVRDPVLGWPFLAPDAERDRWGARVSPAFPDRNTHSPLVSVYGDSFTWSSEVDHTAAWPEVLSRLIDARVDNFGVGGYGSDQALLRYETNCNERSQIVFLVHLTENILRNVNQYRDLLYHGSGIQFKPRFLVGSDDALELIPQPEIPAGQFNSFARTPERFLRHEAFAPGQPEGPIRASFPFTATVARSFTHFHVVAKLRGEPWHASFYAADHHAGGLAVTAGIMERFHRTAQERGQHPIVAVLPTGRDLEYCKRTGSWVYDSLVTELRSRGIPVLDFGPKLYDKMGPQRLEEFFGGLSAHPNEAGYKLVAEVVYEYLMAHDLLSKGLNPTPST